MKKLYQPYIFIVLGNPDTKKGVGVSPGHQEFFFKLEKKQFPQENVGTKLKEGRGKALVAGSLQK